MSGHLDVRVRPTLSYSVHTHHEQGLTVTDRTVVERMPLMAANEIASAVAKAAKSEGRSVDRHSLESEVNVARVEAFEPVLKKMAQKLVNGGKGSTLSLTMDANPNGAVFVVMRLDEVCKVPIT